MGTEAVIMVNEVARLSWINISLWIGAIAAVIVIIGVAMNPAAFGLGSIDR